MSKDEENKVLGLIYEMAALVEGLAVIRELTVWREDSLSEMEKDRLEHMVQPVLYDINKRLNTAMEVMSGDIWKK